MNVKYVLIAGLLAVACDLHAQVGASDTFGHSLTNTTYHWIDITATGEKVIFQGDENSSNDGNPIGIGQPVELAKPFTFYGVTYNQLVPTVNGYLSTDPAEAGGDSLAKCNLPKKPDDGQGDRIYAFHHDWNLSAAASAAVYYQYFPQSPHPHAKCGVHVFSWINVAPQGGGLATHFQALLFDHGDILLNLDVISSVFPANETVGISREDAPDGVGLDCSGPTLGAGSHAFLITTPAVQVANPTQAALEAAILSVPPGGKVCFPVQAMQHVYEADILITKPMTLLGLGLSSMFVADKRFVLDGVSLRVHGAHVNLLGAWMQDAPGQAIALQNGGSVSLMSSALRNTGGIGVAAAAGSRLYVSHSVFDNSRPGSGHHIELLSGSRLHMYRSLLLGCRDDAISFQNSAPSAGEPDLEIVSSSLVLNRCAAVAGEGIAARIVNSTISGNKDDGIRLEDSSLQLHHCTVADQVGAGLNLISCNSTVSHNIFMRNREAMSTVLKNVHRDGGTLTSGGYNLLDSGWAIAAQAGDQLNQPPLLSPLGGYSSFHVGAPDSYVGTPLLCHQLLNGSGGIDGGNDVGELPPGETDLRGRVRQVDSLSDGGTEVDIGAVEMRPALTVTTAADEFDTPRGASVSLREAMRDAERVLFAPGLNNATISLSVSSGGQGFSLQNRSGGNFVDASNLPDQITISGGNQLTVALSEYIDAQNLHFTGGMRSAIRGAGVTMADCRFSDNQFSSPGGSFYDAIGKHGGAFYVNDGSLRLENVTISGNNASRTGGAIYADGDATVELRFVTVYDNRSTGPGAAVLHFVDDSTLHSYASVVSGNQNGPGMGNLEIAPARLLLDVLSPGLLADPSQPALLPLQFVGGATAACPPAPGANIVNRVPPQQVLPQTDARGLTRTYGPSADIGAYELGAPLAHGQPGIDGDNDDMDSHWETYYGLNPGSNADAGSNTDGDALTAVEEYHAGTDPTVSDVTGSVEVTSLAVLSDGRVVIDYNPNGNVGLWSLVTSSDLGTRQPLVQRSLETGFASFILESYEIPAGPVAVFSMERP